MKNNLNESFFSKNEDFQIENRELTGYNGRALIVNIPEGVETIGDYCFWGDKIVKSVNIPEGVRSIKSSAFFQCENLDSVKLPNTLTKIHSDAFLRCTNLREITIPDNVTFILYGAFDRCINLSNVHLSNGLSSIGPKAFAKCRKLTNIVFPASLSSISSYAFEGCDSLESIEFKSDVSIDYHSFTGCENLRKVILPNIPNISRLTSYFNEEDWPGVELVNTLEESLNETEYSEKLEPKSYIGKCGYIKEDGSLIVLDEYHGEDKNLEKRGYVEFSNTHPEEDTCIRLYSKPTSQQCSTMRTIIDDYLNNEGYCKIEIWENGDYRFYKVYSLYEGACEDLTWKENIGDWTGRKLVEIIKEKFN